jgi:hypothetical protein
VLPENIVQGWSRWRGCAEVAGELRNFFVDLNSGIAAQAVPEAGGLQVVAGRRPHACITGRSCLLGAAQKLIDFSPVIAAHHDSELRRYALACTGVLSCAEFAGELLDLLVDLDRE